MGDISKFEEYGFSKTYTGKNQYPYHELYKLGSGSSTNINSNKYTLTINYDILTEKLGSSNFSGIYAQFLQSVFITSTYKSYAFGKVIVKYSDNTTDEIQTDYTYGKKDWNEETKNAFILFNAEKIVSEIKMEITAYDSDYGGAIGYITNIELTSK